MNRFGLYLKKKGVFMGTRGVLGAITLVLIGITAGGCSVANGPSFQPVDAGSDAVLYVFRPDTGFQGSAVEMKMEIDGTQFGVLKPGGYVYQKISPGKHTVRCKTESESTIPFTAEASHSYYVQADIVMGFWVGRPKLTMLTEEIGKNAVLSTKYCGK